MKAKAGKSGAWPLILIGWLVYTTSYLGKVNYSANIAQIIEFYGITKAQAGTVPTFFFFAYGIGQVFNGLFCKKYPIRWMIFASLMTSAAINLAIAITPDFAIVKWLWMVNGIALSVLWPCIIRMLSENLPKKDLDRSSVVIGTTVAAGTLIIYGLSSVYAVFDAFKLAFYTAALADCIVALVWAFSYKKVTAMARAERETEEAVQEKIDGAEATHKKESVKWLRATVCVLCLCAVGINLVKDGLTTWVPSILKETFAVSDSLSILLTLFLPMLAIVGNVCALKVHKWIPDYAIQCGSVFAVIAVLVAGIMGSLHFGWMVCLLVGLILANFLAASLNSLVTSIFPMYMRTQLNSGMFAGIINAFCYLGSTISSYGLGVIADHWGWMAVFGTLLGVGLLICVVCGAYGCVKKRQTVLQ